MQSTACPELVERAPALGELNREGNTPLRGDRTLPIHENSCPRRLSRPKEKQQNKSTQIIRHTLLQAGA